MSLVTKPLTISRIRTYEHHYTYCEPRSVLKVESQACKRRRCLFNNRFETPRRERTKAASCAEKRRCSRGCCWNIFCTKALATTGVVGPACRCSERACKFQNLSSQWKAPRRKRRLQPPAIDLPYSYSCSSSPLLSSRFSIRKNRTVSLPHGW